MQTHHLLDELLHLSCEALQLSTTLHEAATAHYEAVAVWLSGDESPIARFDPQIYAQGSFLIGTTTKPVLQNEFDLDFVCEIQLDHTSCHAVELLEHLELRLREHGTYAPMVERLKRCVRLNYANRFHMDILPAAPESPPMGTRIRVPDRRVAAWKASDPKGYATWFQHRSAQYLLEKRADVEPIPQMQSVEEKSPLQRAVQLAKRARDLFFCQDAESAPRSIVITTLMGHAYRGQRSTAVALHEILASLLDVAAAHRLSPLVVRNPVHGEEILSEQWIAKPQSFNAYRRWLDWFTAGWERVLAAETIPAAKRELAALFGDGVVAEALRKHASRTNELRKSGDLKVDRRGMLRRSTGVSVLPNTFYGDEDA